MPRLTSAHLSEVADWMRRWQPSRQVVADVSRSRIVAEGAGGVLVYETDAVRRLVVARGKA